MDKAVDFYNNNAEALNMKWRYASYFQFVLKRSLALAATKSRSELSVLEVGCGTGQMTGAILATTSFSVFATDISDQMAGICLKNVARYGERVATQVWNVMERAPNLDNKDLVIMMNVVHHIDGDVRLALKNIRSTLKPGGRIILIESNPLNPIWYLHLVRHLNQEKRMIHSTIGNLRCYLEDTDFTDVAAVRYGWVLPDLLVRFPFLYAMELGLQKIPLVSHLGLYNILVGSVKS